eukprot:XP_011669302.1 PREDICTED: glutathione S-transferase theta-1-like [Strongylocentrotus purpuratus]
MVVKVYVDFRTQPSRSLVIFLKNTKIPFEIENIDLVKGDHKKPDYGKVTSLRTAPAIEDGDFSMGETSVFRCSPEESSTHRRKG